MYGNDFGQAPAVNRPKCRNRSRSITGTDHGDRSRLGVSPILAEPSPLSFRGDVRGVARPGDGRHCGPSPRYCLPRSSRGRQGDDRAATVPREFRKVFSVKMTKSEYGHHTKVYLEH